MITPEMAQAELERRQAARMELQRREQMQSALRKEQLRKTIGVDRTPVDTIRDLSSGLLSGLGKGGQMIGEQMEKIPGFKNLQQSVQGATGISVPRVNMDEMFSQVASPNKSMGGELTKSTGEFLPYAYAGGASIPGQIAASTFAGAAENPEDRGKGAIKGAAFGLGGAAIPGVAKLIAKSAEYINPIERARELTKMLQKALEGYKTQSSAQFNKVNRNVGERLINFGEFPGLTEKTTSEFGSRVDKLYKEYKQSPTFENAHKLQSEMNKESMRIGKKLEKSQEDLDQLDAYKKARPLVLKTMKSFLKKESPKDLARYEKGQSITRIQEKPMQKTKALSDLTSGMIDPEVDILVPEQLQKVLQNARKKFPKNQKSLFDEHLMGRSLEDISNRISKGETVKEIIPEGIRKFLPNVVKFAQKPGIQNFAKGAQLPYDVVIKALIANQLRNRNENTGM